MKKLYSKTIKSFPIFFYIICLITFVLTTTACSEDESENENISGTIIGSWEMIDGLAPAMDCTQYMQFRADGTFYNIVVYGNSWNSLFEEGLMDKYDIGKGSWTISGNIVQTIEENSYKSTMTIIKMTSNEMSMTSAGLNATFKRISDEFVNEIIKTNK